MPGQPDSGVFLLLNGPAPGEFSLVVRKASERPLGQPFRGAVRINAAAQVRVKAGALGQGQQGFEQVRTAFGAGQKRMVAQRLGGLPQVTAAGAFKVKADQIDDAVFGFFKVRAQELVAKIARNLHHAFGGLGADGV